MRKIVKDWGVLNLGFVACYALVWIVDGKLGDMSVLGSRLFITVCLVVLYFFPYWREKIMED